MKYDLLTGKSAGQRKPFREVEAHEASKKRHKEAGNEVFRAIGLPEIESPEPLEEGMEDINGTRRFGLGNAALPATVGPIYLR